MIERQKYPIDVAKHVAYFANKIKVSVGSLKIQQILFYIEGLHYVIYGRPLLGVELNATRQGIEIKEVADEYKDDSIFKIVIKKEANLSAFSITEIALIDYIAEQKLSLTTLQLVKDIKSTLAWKAYHCFLDNHPPITTEKLRCFRCLPEHFDYKKKLETRLVD